MMRRYQDSIALGSKPLLNVQSDSRVQARGGSMTMSRIVEFSFSCIIAFLVLIVISFLTLRPMLKEITLEARAGWDAFRRAVAERSELLPGMVEGLRGFQPGLGKLSEKLLESRAISLRAVDQDAMVASAEVMEGYLAEIERLVQSNPALEKYPPFATRWKKVQVLNERIRFLREDYSRIARLHNRVLTVFPQNVLAVLFGYVPLKEYPPRRTPSG